MARSCRFEHLEDSLIRDRIVMGVRYDNLRRKLLQDNNLNLEKCIDVSKAYEISDNQMQHLQITESTEMIAAVDKEQVYKRKGRCRFCNRTHEFIKEKCPAWGKLCTFCNGRNHFSTVCKKKIHSVSENLTASNRNDQEEEVFMIQNQWIMAVDDGKQKRMTALMGVNNVEIRFQLDSAADVNTINQKYVRKDQIKSTGQKLIMWNKTKMKPLGKATITTINLKTKERFEVEYIVVPNGFTCLLGLSTITKMKLININDDKFIAKIDLNEDTNVHQSATGDLGEASLKLDQHVTPKVLPCRRIPLSLKDKVKAELDSLIKRGILEEINEPTEWVSQMAIVEKVDGKIRLCIDPQQLNKALMREHYNLATLDDILPELNNAKIFSKIDVKEAFWHVRLDSKSSKFTTMITPFGRFKWNRLPFGLKVSSEIFQRFLNQALEGISGCFNVVDDIIVIGKGDTQEEALKNHDENLSKLLNRCKEKNIRLNEMKSVFRKSEIVFLGHIISHSGIKPDPNKVRAIINLKVPEDISSVRRFCGMVQYLSRFIPDLSAELQPITELTKKHKQFLWSNDCLKAFNNVKQKISTHGTLSFFDPKKQVTLQADSSQNGLGAVLLQDEKPIAYSSRSLTESQKRWAQIEKELLAVVVALERFDQYMYGRPVVVQNDH